MRPIMHSSTIFVFVHSLLDVAFVIIIVVNLLCRYIYDIRTSVRERKKRVSATRKNLTSIP
nr:hypothetical protein TLHOJNLA_TLHOJNLA_CDS_0006 [Microvirus sp.]